jgi:hypothetical protein
MKKILKEPEDWILVSVLAGVVLIWLFALVIIIRWAFGPAYV